MIWKLADAKNKLSEVVRRALVEGPQRIERRGEAVVVLSARDYARLTGTRPSFVEFLRSAEGLSDLDLTRDRAPLRDLDL
jgi:prevent-host-death family protein